MPDTPHIYLSEEEDLDPPTVLVPKPTPTHPQTPTSKDKGKGKRTRAENYSARSHTPLAVKTHSSHLEQETIEQPIVTTNPNPHCVRDPTQQEYNTQLPEHRSYLNEQIARLAHPTLHTPKHTMMREFLQKLYREGGQKAHDMKASSLNMVESWLTSKYGATTRPPPRQLLNNTSSGPQGRPGNASQTTPSNNYNQRYTGRGTRAANYKKAQDLHNTNRRTLCDMILSGKPLNDVNETLTIEQIEKIYIDLFSERSKPDNGISSMKSPHSLTFKPITPEEVNRAKMGWSNTAPGPDGVTVRQIKQTDDEWLVMIYSIILLSGIKPARFSLSRTTLIYRTDERRDPANYRPITVSSTIQRLLHRIIANLIRNATDLNINQRAFTTLDGTLANCLILENFIRSRWDNGKPMPIVSLDLAKAFDRVSHLSIERALHRQGIQIGMISYIMDSVKNNMTYIRLGKQVTAGVKINRGVRQGDPLSPILFNLVLDEILEDINNNLALSGTRTNATTTIAFADYIVVMEEDPTRMQATVDRAVTFAESKCS